MTIKACTLVVLGLSSSLIYMYYLNKEIVESINAEVELEGTELTSFDSLDTYKLHQPYSSDLPPSDSFPLFGLNSEDFHPVNILYRAGINADLIVKSSEVFPRCYTPEKENEIGYELFKNPNIKAPCVRVLSQYAYIGTPEQVKDYYELYINDERNRGYSSNAPFYRFYALYTDKKNGICIDSTFFTSMQMTQFELVPDSTKLDAPQWQGTPNHILKSIMDFGSGQNISEQAKKVCELSKEKMHYIDELDCVTSTSLIIDDGCKAIKRAVVRAKNNKESVTSTNQFALFGGVSPKTHTGQQHEPAVQATNTPRI